MFLASNTPALFYRSALKLVLPLALMPIAAHAADFTWTGAADNDWTNQANWNDGISGAPSTYEDWAIFPNSAPATTVVIPSNTTIESNVQFDTGGWEIAGSNLNSILKLRSNSGAPTTPLISNGSGINTITTRTWVDLNSDFNVGSGNTLVFDSVFNDNSLTQTGDGTMIVNGTYSSGTSGIGSEGGGLTLVNTTFTTNRQRPFADAGGTLGGNGTIVMNVTSAGNFQVRIGNSSAATLAPGGNGTTEGGDAIGTLTVDFTSNLNGGGVVTIYDDSSLAIDLASPSSHDVLAIVGSGTANDDAYISLTGSNQILELFGPDTPIAGDYTIVTQANLGNLADYGQFESIFYNDVDVTLDDMYSLAYNLNDITLTIVPEPSVYALLGGMAMLGFVCLHRRKA